MISHKLMIELAKRAGYGTVHYGRDPKDGVTVNEWDEHIWGGPMETARLQNYTRLVLEQVDDRREEIDQLRRELQVWQAQYQALIEQVAKGIALQPPPPIVITKEQYESSGLPEVLKANRQAD